MHGTRGAQSTAAFVYPVQSQKAIPMKHPILSGPILRHPLTVNQRIVSLHAKRKGPGGPPISSKKLQVKLLKYVPGIGQKGDIVRVAPAVLNNVLKPSQAAELITDDEIAQERAAAAASELEVDRKAKSLKEEIEAKEFTLIRKAGPDGKLFGGVGPKSILEELMTLLGASGGFLKTKGVKITAIVDSDGTKIQGDIKQIGSFAATLLLTKAISARISLDVKPE